jgi:monoamine oxidase
MGCEVVDFDQDENQNKVAAIYRDPRNHNRQGREEGDFLICTMPLPVVARREAHRRFSAKKRLAMRDLHYESAIIVLIPTTTRFWEKQHRIFGGASYTDLMPGSLYYPSDNIGEENARSDGPGILSVSDCWGQDARCLGNIPAEECEELTIKLFGRSLHGELLQPGVVGRSETKSWYWDCHPWAGGAFAFYMPGQFSALHRHIIAPEGRIYLAGEHCSRMHSWMEGALASAHDVVGSILRQDRREAAESYTRASGHHLTTDVSVPA